MIVEVINIIVPAGEHSSIKEVLVRFSSCLDAWIKSIYERLHMLATLHMLREGESTLFIVFFSRANLEELIWKLL
jgi:hypothetical protein